MSNLVTIFTFTYPHEAIISRGRLEAECIECFLMDENIISVNPFLSNAIGGVKLQVQEKDVQRAIQILHGLDSCNDDIVSNEEEELIIESPKKSKNNGCLWFLAIVLIIAIIFTIVFLIQ